MGHRRVGPLGMPHILLRFLRLRYLDLEAVRRSALQLYTTYIVDMSEYDIVQTRKGFQSLKKSDRTFQPSVDRGDLFPFMTWQISFLVMFSFFFFRSLCPNWILYGLRIQRGIFYLKLSQ